MKIAITIELDKESAELFQTPFKKLSDQINDLMGLFGKKVEVNTESDPEPNINVDPKPDLDPNIKTSKPLKPKKRTKTRLQRPVKATILKTIKKNKDGIKAKDLQEQTGFTGKQISNNMFHLKKDKKIEKTKEGLFIAL
ncbi:hypothetical protein [Desulfobacula sp.]